MVILPPQNLQRQRSNTFPMDAAAATALAQAADSGSGSGRGSPPPQPPSPDKTLNFDVRPPGAEFTRRSSEQLRLLAAFSPESMSLRPPRCAAVEMLPVCQCHASATVRLILFMFCRLLHALLLPDCTGCHPADQQLMATSCITSRTMQAADGADDLGSEVPCSSSSCSGDSSAQLRCWQMMPLSSAMKHYAYMPSVLLLTCIFQIVHQGAIELI